MTYDLWDCARHGHQRVEYRDGTGVNARIIYVGCAVCGKALS